MKTRYIISTITVLTMVSCQLQDPFKADIDSDVQKLSLTIESIDATKTFMDANNIVHWSEEDKVVVFNGTTEGSAYVLHEDFVGETYGEFVFVEKIPANSKLEQIDHNIIVYPFNNDTACHNVVSDGNSYELTSVYIPANQKYTKGSFSKSSFPMVAVSEFGSTNLSFRNLCGMIKLQLSGECAVKSIKLSGNKNEKISGEAKVVINTEGDIPTIEMSENAGKYITLDCSKNPVQLNTDIPTTFILSLPPTNFKAGFTVVVTDIDGNEMTLQTNRKQNVKRSSILRMPPTSVNDSQFSSFGAYINEVAAYYVDVAVQANGSQTFAYVLSTTEMNFSNPAVVFTTGTIVDINETDVIRISDGIEEDTKYHLYIVAKQENETFSEIIYLPFNTPVFEATELLTVIDRSYDGYKMRITVPEYVKRRGNAIRLAQTDIMTYNYMRHNDYFNLLYNGSYTKYVTDNQMIEYSEELNWHQTDWDSDGNGELDWEYHYNPISPGEPIVYLAGEFSWMDGKEDETDYVTFPKEWEPGYYMPCVSDEFFTVGSANEQSSMGIITDYEITRPGDPYWTGAFQRKHFRVREPEHLDGGVEVKLVEQGPVDLTFEFYPDENVYQYAFGIFNEAIYEQILELCNGREDYLQWAITSYFSAYTFSTHVCNGPISMKLTDLYYQDAIAADSDYHVLITAMGDKSGSTQSFQKHTFKTSKKTKDAPEVLVTPLPEKSTPYEAVFNIKCTTFADNPFTECYFAANYVRDWLLEVNGGATYFSLVAGNKAYNYFTAEELEKINSAEGYDISIPSIDGETTRLVILGYNDEYTPNDLVGFESVDECTGIADCTTPWLPAKDRIAGEYYTDLVGNWTATATLQPATEGSKSFIHKSKITITDNLTEHHPASLTNDVYKLYEEKSKYDKAKVDALYAEFKTLAEVVTWNRLTYQNRLVAMGWLDADSYKRLDSYTPYDLFIDKTYKPVDVSSIFNDYGPKWYIEAVEDEDGNVSLIAPFDSNLLPPSANWSVPFYFSGLEPYTYYAVTYAEDGSAAFPVEVSEDRNTITIKPYVYTDWSGTKTTFYPNMIGVDNSTYSTFLENAVVSDVVLTRGWTEPAEQKSASVLKSASNVQVEGTFPVKTYKQRTPLNAAPELETVETSLVTMEQFKERADKFIEMKFKQNN